MVKRHITIPFNFYCLTEDKEGIDSDVIIIPIQYDLKIWWNKLAMFEKGFGDLKGQCLYFDLDIVIQKDIECFIKKHFHKIHCYWKNPNMVESDKEVKKRNTINNSSIMSWTANDELLNEVWQEFIEEKEWFLELYRGIDRYMDWEFPYLINSYDRNLVYSYREGADWYTDTEPFTYRKNYHVCIFHQEPNITDCLDHPVVTENWK
tara:strand:- start:2461 stop:3078 length:618 start_codon:yes stop_codon:yes gene_type:complete